VSTHQNIYYKRITDYSSFDAYSNFLVTWSSSNNILGTDFNLYSNLADALAETNPWTTCNYDHPGIAFPRDCGPNGLDTNLQFNSFTWAGGCIQDYQYKVLTGTTSVLVWIAMVVQRPHETMKSRWEALNIDMTTTSQEPWLKMHYNSMAVAGTDLLGPTVPYPQHGARSLFTANNGEAGFNTAIEVLSGSRVPSNQDAGRNGRFSSVWLLLVNKIDLYLSFNDAADNNVETRCL
jgi:hypothetical protein